MQFIIGAQYLKHCVLGIAYLIRVLKPGGMFMFSYGLESNATMRYWADQIDAMNLLPMEEISKILADTGFENLQTATKGDYTINIRIRKPEASN